MFKKIMLLVVVPVSLSLFGPFGMLVGFAVFVYAVLKFYKKPINNDAKTKELIEYTNKPATITINARPTKRFTKLVAEDVPVAGISYRQEVITKLIEGTGRKILLEREPDNKHDKKAIKILARWKVEDEEYIEHVGYVPKEIAAKIAKKYPNNDLLGCLSVIFTPSADRSAGMRFSIYAAPEE